MKRILTKILLASLLSSGPLMHAMALSQWIKSSFSSIRTSIYNTSTKAKILVGLGTLATGGIAALCLYKYWNSRNQPPANADAAPVIIPPQAIVPPHIPPQQPLNQPAVQHNPDPLAVPIPAPAPPQSAQKIAKEPEVPAWKGQIFIKNQSFGRALAIDVHNATDTIANIKQRIRSEHSMAQDIRLKLMFRGQELHDNKKLADYPIKNEDYVSLILGKSEPLDAKKLYIKTLTGATHTINFEDAHVSIYTILQEIENGMGIPVKAQHLFYGKQEIFRGYEPLANATENNTREYRIRANRTLQQRTSDYSIKRGDSLLLLVIPRRMFPVEERVRIPIDTFNGRTVVYNGYISDTIKKIKLALHVSHGFPLDQQVLMFEGCQLEDDRKISDYGLSSTSRIDQIFRINQKKHNSDSKDEKDREEDV